MNQKEKLAFHKKLVTYNEVLEAYEQDLALAPEKYVTVFPGDFFISADYSLDYVYYVVAIVISVDVKNNNVTYLQYTREKDLETTEIDSINLVGKSSYTLWIWKHKTQLKSPYTYCDFNREFWHFRT